MQQFIAPQAARSRCGIFILFGCTVQMQLFDLRIEQPDMGRKLAHLQVRQPAVEQYRRNRLRLQMQQRLRPAAGLPHPPAQGRQPFA